MANFFCFSEASAPCNWLKAASAPLVSDAGLVIFVVEGVGLVVDLVWAKAAGMYLLPVRLATQDKLGLFWTLITPFLISDLDWEDMSAVLESVSEELVL